MSAETEVADALVEILAEHPEDLFGADCAAQAFEICEHLREAFGLDVSGELEQRLNEARKRVSH